MTPHEQFLAERRGMLGATDSPAILWGKHFDKTPQSVWRHKTGRPCEQADGPDLQRGIMLEPIARQLYAERTGRRIDYNPAAYRHPVHPFIGCHIDGIIHDPARATLGVLEIKCPRVQGYYAARDGRVNNNYMTQMQHCMAVTGMTWGSFCVFSAELWDLTFFDVDYSPEFGAAIVERCRHFWESYVVTDIMPSNVQEVFGMPLPIFQTNQTTINRETPAWQSACDAYAQAESEHAKAAAEEKTRRDALDAAEERIKELVRHECAQEKRAVTLVQLPGYDVHVKAQAGRMSFRKKDLMAGRPVDRRKLLGCLLTQGVVKTAREFDALVAHVDVDFDEYESRGEASEIVKVFARKTA